MRLPLDVRGVLAGAACAALVLAGCGGESTRPQNRSPSAEIFAPSDGSTFVEGDEVTFRGSASDPDQGELSGSALSWESDLDGDLGTGTTVTRSDLSRGEHVVTLTATDGQGATGGTSVSITVEENDPPSASIASPADGDTVGQGAPVEFRGSGDDPEEGALTGGSLAWESDLDGELGTGSPLTRTDLSVGDHVVTLTASDPQGASGTATVSLTVEANGQPGATITSPADGATFLEDESIDFQGSGSDPEDGTLTGGSLVWTSDLDGEIGTGASFSRSDLSSGDHTITLEATDSRGAAATARVDVSVEGEPTATISSPADSSLFDEGAVVSLQGSATDPGDGALTGSSLVWSSDVDGELGTGESLSESGLSPGPHTIALTATDSEGSTGADSVELVVEGAGFTIRIREVDDLISSERKSVQAALEPWETAITGDLAGGYLPAPDPSNFSSDTNECLADPDGGVDDLLVCVFVRDLGGSGGTLAQAGPALIRTADGLPILGLVFIDDADRGHPQLREIMTHEVGHVLGIGVGGVGDWGTNRHDLATNDPYFTGSEAEAAFDALGGEAYLSDGVPLANTGGGGTQGAHWRETNFQQELMTGFLNSGVSNPLSRISLSALADIGYQVDVSRAESYSLPMPQVALWEAEADATLSEPASGDQNFGLPDGSLLSESLAIGANDGTWSTDPDDELLAALVRFDVPAVPAGVSITEAWLRVFQRQLDPGSATHDVEVSSVNEAWSEGSVTADSRPSSDGTPLLTFDHDSCPSNNYCWRSSSRLEDLVRAWISGSTANHGLTLRAPSAASDPSFSVGFWTRHATDPAQRPDLRISAQTGASVRRLVAEPGEGLRMIGDVLETPVYGLTPDGTVVTRDGRELVPAPSP